jgi:hypothetical protein
VRIQIKYRDLPGRYIQSGYPEDQFPGNITQIDKCDIFVIQRLLFMFDQVNKGYLMEIIFV